MKFEKIFIFLITLILLLTLTGCTGGVYRQPDQQYLVSGIAFKRDKSRIIAFAETVVVNTESTEQGVSRHIFSASGNTAEESLLNLSGKISKPLLFDHCGLIAVDKDLSSEQFSQVIDYCKKNEEINLAAYMISSENTDILFDCEPVSTLTVSYDLLGVIDRVEFLNGIKFHNRYYEVCANKLRESRCFFLPLVLVNKGEYILSGGDVYIDNKMVDSLELTEGALYCLLTDNFSDGKFEDFEISDSKTRFECDLREDTLFITLNIKADLEKGDYAYLSDKIERTLENLRGNTDIFGFNDRISRKYRSLWNTVKDNYNFYYTNAKIEVKYEF